MHTKLKQELAHPIILSEPSSRTLSTLLDALEALQGEDAEQVDVAPVLDQIMSAAASGGAAEIAGVTQRLEDLFRARGLM